MNCPECSAEIPRGWVRCAECGHMLEGSEWRGMIEREPRNDDLQLRSVYSSMDFIMALVMIVFICGSIAFGYTRYSNIVDFAKNKIEVSFAVESRLNNGQIQIFGTTNLPEGTDLIISVAGNDYQVTSKAKVVDGGFSTKEFSIEGKGTYNLEVIMPSALLQDDEIQKRIGKHGEMLTGQYVSKNSGNLVKYESNIEIN